jgi:DNA-binding CsgD family transcriptional regulator
MGRQKISYDLAILTEAVSSGKTYAELADFFKVSIGTIKKWLNESNLEVLEKWKKAARVSERDLKCRQMRAEGKTLQEIGEVVGVTREAVRQSLNKQGVKPLRVLSEKAKTAKAMRAVRLEEIKTLYWSDIESLLRDGLPLVEIRARYSLSIQQVKDLKLGQVRAAYDNARLEEVVRLYEEGLSMSLVSERTGYHIQSVLRILKKRGVKRRARHRWNSKTKS